MNSFQRMLLAYLRGFPVDYGKNILKRALLGDSFRAGLVTHSTSGGDRFLLDLGDHVQREIFLNDVYERNTFRHLRRLVGPGSTVIDCGSNIGAYAIPIARLVAPGRVIAFEPHPVTFRRLEANILLNRLDNVEAVPLGLSDCVEEMTLFGESLTTASAHKHRDSSHATRISCTTIDRYCAEHGISKVDFMKVDIEGGEMKCLRGAEATIGRNRRLVLQVEIDSNCEHSGVTRQELFRYITSMGFDAWQPRGFPFAMRRLHAVDDRYSDNVLFTRHA